MWTQCLNHNVAYCLADHHFVAEMIVIVIFLHVGLVWGQFTVAVSELQICGQSRVQQQLNGNNKLINILQLLCSYLEQLLCSCLQCCHYSKKWKTNKNNYAYRRFWDRWLLYIMQHGIIAESSYGSFLQYYHVALSIHQVLSLYSQSVRPDLDYSLFAILQKYCFISISNEMG